MIEILKLNNFLIVIITSLLHQFLKTSVLFLEVTMPTKMIQDRPGDICTLSITYKVSHKKAYEISNY